MYIVIETHGGAEYACIQMNEDGSNMVFDTEEEAQIEAAECQYAIVVQI